MSPTELTSTDGAAGRVRFKDLVLDAVQPAVAARFWAAALGLTATDRGDLYLLTDDDPTHTLWVNPVPEPQTVKQRVHLDVHVRAVEDLVALGAEVVEELPHWTLLRDPEGGELCAFVRAADRLPAYRLYELVVDAVDHARIAAWWGDVLGVEAQHEPDKDFSWLEGAPGLPWEVVFQPVPEAKQVKNRIHWDVWGHPPDLLAAGAQLVRARDGEIAWDVLADPEGNEFCVFPLAPVP